MINFYSKARDQMYKEHRLRVMNAKSVLSSLRAREPKKDPESATFEEYLAQIVNTVRPSMFTFTKSPENISMTQVPPVECPRQQQPIRPKTPKTLKSRTIFLMKKNKRHKGREIFVEDGQIHIRSRSQINDAIPHRIIQRYRATSDIGNIVLLRKLLRPKIFLEFYSAHNEKNFGHLEIQLFTEACPAIVLEFVRMCTRGQRERLMITHVVDPISLECELALSRANTLSDENFEYDTTAIDHGSGPGILTCPLRYVHGTRNSRLRFSITLRPLSVLNGKRVAFGKVFGDMRLLQRVQHYSEIWSGNLKIRVRTCGIEK